MMYLEGIIVCVNYSDFLAHTLPHNKSHFDNLVVVTDTSDKSTKWLCEYYNVKCIQTDIFYENSDKFNKGAAIDLALKQLDKKGWVLHLDSDIYLPPKTRFILNNLNLDESKIYGADRLMCPNYESWIDFIDNPQKIQEGWVYVHLDAFPVGVRLAEYHSESGWEPLGYFQMWNPKVSGVSNYPTEHGLADRTDVLQAKKWTREKRELLPEIITIHLDSEGLNTNQMGKNWQGRKTKLFSRNKNTKLSKKGYRKIVFNSILKRKLKKITLYALITILITIITFLFFNFWGFHYLNIIKSLVSNF